MKWYFYVAIIVLALICYFFVVDVRSRKGVKDKRAAERQAAKKSRSSKKKKKK